MANFFKMRHPWRSPFNFARLNDRDAAVSLHVGNIIRCHAQNVYFNKKRSVTNTFFFEQKRNFISI